MLAERARDAASDTQRVPEPARAAYVGAGPVVAPPAAYSSEAPSNLGFGSQPPASAVGSGRWAEERKLATVVFADIVGFSAIANDLEPDAVRELANAFFEPLSREVEREGGTVMKYVNDGIMAAFGVPTAHEDDAIRAVRAALAMTGRVREIARERNREFALRVGIYTGLVMVGTVGGGTRASADIMGATVNIASRIEGSAAPGEILVGAATERLVHDCFVMQACRPCT